jgi:hypothetical protein
LDIELDAHKEEQLFSGQYNMHIDGQSNELQQTQQMNAVQQAHDVKGSNNIPDGN